MPEETNPRVLVLYPPKLGYYVDREFLALLPGFATTYAFDSPTIAHQFRVAPHNTVYPRYYPVVPGLPVSASANFVIRDLTTLIDDLRPSMVMTYECFSALSAQVARSPRRLTFRHVVMCYETVVPSKSLWGWFPITRLYARDTCLTADLFIAHSVLASRALSAMGVPRPRILVRPPGVYPDNHGSVNSHDSLIGNVTGVVYIGSLTRNKGILTFANAAVKLAKIGHLKSQLRFSVVGAGPLGSEVQRRTAILGPGFRMHGRVSEQIKQAILAEASILVCPSEDITLGPLVRWEEQTATAAMEAMITGTPVIGSNSGALPEIIGQGGWIFSQGSADALAKLIAEVADSPSELARAAKNALIAGTTRYDIYGCARDIAAKLRALEET